MSVWREGGVAKREVEEKRVPAVEMANESDQRAG
jgi:hypothetical protein